MILRIKLSKVVFYLLILNNFKSSEFLFTVKCAERIDLWSGAWRWSFHGSFWSNQRWKQDLRKAGRSGRNARLDTTCLAPICSIRLMVVTFGKFELRRGLCGCCCPGNFLWPLEIMLSSIRQQLVAYGNNSTNHSLLFVPLRLLASSELSISLCRP